MQKALGLDSIIRKKRHWKAAVMIDSEWLNVIHKTVALSSYGYGQQAWKIGEVWSCCFRDTRAETYRHAVIAVFCTTTDGEVIVISSVCSVSV